MEVLTRKQREIQDRETKILAIARRILIAEGYQQLSMERLAAEIEYAKGTLYNHFPNKEEIVAALAIESLELRRAMFEFASTMATVPRLRLTAIGCVCDVYADQFMEHFTIEQMLRNATIWEKSSPKRHELIRRCEYRSMSIVAGVTRDAIAVKDLILPAGMTAEEFVFGFWSLTYGSYLLIASSPSLPDIGVNDPFRSMRYHAWVMMNGYNWKPLISFEESELFRIEVAERVNAEFRS